MFVGLQDKQKIFKKLTSEGRLAHGYLFWGEEQIGKFLFAKSLANLLEHGRFAEPESALTETLIVQPEGGSIGIDSVRLARQFLAQKPISSTRRLLLIDRAETLTNQAQNAILKLAEEPPGDDLIILVTSGLDTVLPTLRSRLQKIYFTRVPQFEIEKLLTGQHKLTPSEASSLAKRSFGKPGFAVSLLENKVSKDIDVLADKFLKNPAQRNSIIKDIAEHPDLPSQFLARIVLKLCNEPVKNCRALGKILNRLTRMSDFTVNKRLQLEAALWNI
jgi:DNA polymerase-3 subunit delta'